MSSARCAFCGDRFLSNNRYSYKYCGAKDCPELFHPWCYDKVFEEEAKRGNPNPWALCKLCWFYQMFPTNQNSN